MVFGWCFGNHVPRQPAIPSEVPVLPGMQFNILGFNCTALCRDLNLSIIFLSIFCVQMKTIVETLGQPEDELLSDGTNTLLYFSPTKDSTRPAWRLKVCNPILHCIKRSRSFVLDLVATVKKVLKICFRRLMSTRLRLASHRKFTEAAQPGSTVSVT